MHIQAFSKEIRSDSIPVALYIYSVNTVKVAWEENKLCLVATNVYSHRNERIPSILRIVTNNNAVEEVVEAVRANHPGLNIICS